MNMTYHLCTCIAEHVHQGEAAEDDCVPASRTHRYSARGQAEAADTTRQGDTVLMSVICRSASQLLLSCSQHTALAASCGRGLLLAQCTAMRQHQHDVRCALQTHL
jgi:hypothetical protein